VFQDGNCGPFSTFDIMDHLKEHLHRIADRLTAESTLEDVYEQLALLADIESSEEDEREGRVYSTTEVKTRFEKWLE